MIGKNSYQTLDPNEIQSTHESSGHVNDKDSCCHLRSTASKKDFPIYVCNTSGKVFVSTFFQSTDNITSSLSSPDLVHNQSGAISATNAAAGLTSPDKNHLALKNFSVGNR